MKVNFICGLLIGAIGATSIVGWVVAIIEEEKNELKSEILKRTAYLEKTTNPLHITNTKNTDTIIEYMLQVSDLNPSLIQCILCPVAISTGVGSGNGTKTSYKFPN